MEDIWQRIKFKQTYYTEIKKIKEIQKKNLNTYLLSICDYQNILYNYTSCINTKIDEKNCIKEKGELYLCESIKNSYKKAFKEKQLEFFEKAFNEYKEKNK